MLCSIINSDEGDITISITSVEKAKKDFGYVASILHGGSPVLSPAGISFGHELRELSVIKSVNQS